MRNREVVREFLNHEPTTGSNLYSTGDKLVSYATTIAEWQSGKVLLVNNTSYSRTTSKQRNYLYPIPDYIEVITLENVPKETESLNYYFINQ